jgi:hypothetical protein
MPKLPLWKLECYLEEDGVAPILVSIVKLPLECQQEAEALKRLLEDSGNTIAPNRLIRHREGLFELVGQSVRIFCKFADDRRVILIDVLPASQDNISLDPIFRKAASL